MTLEEKIKQQYERTKENYKVAQSRDFKCLLCRQKSPTVGFAFKKTGYYCFVCSVIMNLMTIAFVIIVGFVLLSNAILN